MRPKVKNLLGHVKICLQTGNYLFTSHANERLQWRQISRPEIKQILRYGYHEKRKDKFEKTYLCWNYSIRGETVDQRDIRIVVSFHEEQLLIITAINLKNGK